MVVCEWCLINVNHDVALHSARLLNNFDDIKKAYTGTKNINMANKPSTRVFQQTFGAVAICQE